jgi:TP901-1 family phage major tail protein
MGAQKGKDLLLRAGDGAGGFLAVAGLRTRQITLNAETVDVTNADSTGRWRELLAGAGVRRAAIAGSGVFRDQASDLRLRLIFFEGAIETLLCVLIAQRLMRPFDTGRKSELIER